MVLDSIKSVFALMALIASGFYFAGKPWFGKQGMDFLSKFTVEATIPFYFSGTIESNILYGNPDGSEAKMKGSRRNRTGNRIYRRKT